MPYQRGNPSGPPTSRNFFRPNLTWLSGATFYKPYRAASPPAPPPPQSTLGRISIGRDARNVPELNSPESGLASDVPQLDGDVALGDLPHVEANGGNHVFVELAGSDDVDEGRLSGVLEPHQGQFHLFLPEERLEPLQEAIDHGQHVDCL